MSGTNVKVLNEVQNGKKNNWRLCFQYCEYNYEDGSKQKGYRFIWRKPDNKLQPARGQARIPSIAEMLELTSKAMKDGWGNFEEETTGHAYDEE